VPLDSASDALDAGLPITLLSDSPSLPSALSPGVFAPPRAASYGFPGVLGVLPVVKAANAPDPRPKLIFSGPPPGEARLPPGVGRPLKGLDLPCEELSPPKRLEKEALRLEGPASPPFWLVANESLFELVRKTD
jgi:hypothetical protein